MVNGECASREMVNGFTTHHSMLKSSSCNISSYSLKSYICDMKRRDVIIQRIVEMINRTEPNAELYLYGSRARGTAKRHSDWDLLLLLNSDQLSFDYETRLLDNFYEIELETGEVFSPLIYTKRDWQTHHRLTPLFTNITKEGIKII